jgi:hypothetical protein
MTLCDLGRRWIGRRALMPLFLLFLHLEHAFLVLFFRRGHIEIDKDGFRAKAVVHLAKGLILSKQLTPYRS